MKLGSRRVLVLACGLLALAPQARVAAAQGFAPPPPDQPDFTLDAATRRAVVDTLMDAVQRYYVFPERGQSTAKALKKRLAAREYDRITSAKEFADSLTAHLQDVTHDLHLRVHYRHEPLPVQTEQEPSAAEIAKSLEQERRLNFGFDKLQRLPGNVGYLDLRQFSDESEAQPVALAAMQFLGATTR